MLKKIIATNLTYNNNTACEMVIILTRNYKGSLKITGFICGKEVQSYSF